MATPTKRKGDNNRPNAPIMIVITLRVSSFTTPQANVASKRYYADPSIAMIDSMAWKNRNTAGSPSPFPVNPTKSLVIGHVAPTELVIDVSDNYKYATPTEFVRPPSDHVTKKNRYLSGSSSVINRPPQPSSAGGASFKPRCLNCS